jgi:hypothetical protein
MTECMAVFYICKTNYKNHKIWKYKLPHLQHDMTPDKSWH